MHTLKKLLLDACMPKIAEIVGKSKLSELKQLLLETCKSEASESVPEAPQNLAINAPPFLPLVQLSRRPAAPSCRWLWNGAPAGIDVPL